MSRFRIKRQYLSLLLTASLFLSVISGCSPSDTLTVAESSENTAAPADDTSQAADTAELVSSDMFTDKDLAADYAVDATIELINDQSSSSSESVSIVGNILTISAAGTYTISGSLDNGQIVVDAGIEDKIQLILQDLDINCDSSAAIYVKQADKVFITLEGNNTLSNQEDFIPIDDNNIDAVIFSKDDLSFNGEGSMSIQAAYGHGIVSKDDLVIASGDYTIESAGHALEGNDSVRIANGSFKIRAGTDGIQSDNSEDDASSFIYIEGGSFDITAGTDGLDVSGSLQIDDGTYIISAGDDGIHADTNVTVNGGTLTVTDSFEALEGQSIDINGGLITLKSSDDGLNAAGGNDASATGFLPDRDMFTADADCYIRISGGELTINAQGDGIDSNGDLSVSGGASYISTPTNTANSALDYGGTAQITGGIFIAAGGSGMAQNFGTTSTQGAILLNLSSGQNAGSAVILEDDAGHTIVSYLPEYDYTSIVVSAPDIEVGSSYTLAAGDTSETITMESLIYGNGMGGFGGGPGGFGALPGDMPDMPAGSP